MVPRRATVPECGSDRVRQGVEVLEVVEVDRDGRLRRAWEWSGIFLILEDQVRIGDLARINGVAGTVEQINLRTIIVRDAEGAVQVFPNGTVWRNDNKGGGYDVVLAGRAAGKFDETPIDVDAWQAKIDSPGYEPVKASLSEVGYALRFCREVGLLPDEEWSALNDRQSRARFLTLQLYRSLGR